MNATSSSMFGQRVQGVRAGAQRVSNFSLQVVAAQSLKGRVTSTDMQNTVTVTVER